MTFGEDILNKNKMKNNLESGDIYIGNVNTNESIYCFLVHQQDNTKKLMDIEFTAPDDYNFYVDEYLVGVTEDLYDMHSHSTSKFLFYNFDKI